MPHDRQDREVIPVMRHRRSRLECLAYVVMPAIAVLFLVLLAFHDALQDFNTAAHGSAAVVALQARERLGDLLARQAVEFGQELDGIHDLGLGHFGGRAATVTIGT